MRKRRQQTEPAVVAAIIHDAALLAAVFYSPIYWGGFGSAGQTFAAWVVAVALAAALVARFSQRLSLSTLPNAVHLPALAFLGVSALSAMFSVSVHDSKLELSRLIVGAVLFALVASRAAMPAAPAKPVAALFACFALALPFVKVTGEADITLDLLTIAAAILVCGLMLAQRSRPDPIRWWWQAMVTVAAFAVAVAGLKEWMVAHFVLHNSSWRIFATFFNPNPLGGYLATAIPLAVSAILATVLRWARWTWTCGAALLLLALLPTYSKGAAVGLVVAVAIYLLLLATRSSKPRRNLMLVLGVYLLVAVLAFGALAASHALRERVSGMLGPRSASNMFRILTWRGTLNMAADHLWVGIGPGAFKHLFPKYAIAGYVEAAHQNYLQVFAEQGAFGAAAFLWLIGAVLFTGWRAISKAPGFQERIICIGAISGIIVLLVHSLFDYDWYVGAISLNFWLLAGVLAHYAHGRPIALPVEETRLPAGGQAVRPARRRRRRTRSPARADDGGPSRRGVRGRRSPWPGRLGEGASRRDFILAALLLGAIGAAAIASTRSALAEWAVFQGETAIAEAQQAAEQRNSEAEQASRERARSYFEAARGYDPGWATAWGRLGLFLPGTGWEQCLRTAISLEPTDYQWRALLAQKYEVEAQAGKDPKQALDYYRQALQYYQQAIDLFPNSTHVLRAKAEVYQRLGEEKSALVLYRHMVELEHSPYQRYRALDVDVDTEFAYAHYQLGRAAAKGRRAEELKQAASEFLEALRVIGDYQFRGKNTDEMFAQVKRPRAPRAQEMQLLEGKARWRLAGLYRRLGDARTADLHRQLALSLVPGVAQAVADEEAVGRGLPSPPPKQVSR